jgi:zinc/manganese transport system ATP-binding protein
VGRHRLGAYSAVSDTAISLNDVTIAYNRHVALHRIHGRFAPGSLTAICGPNGAGKSTLLKAIVGSLSPAEGSIRRDGLVAADFGYLPQEVEVDRSFPLTVGDTVLLGAWRHIGAFRGAGRTIVNKARAALAAVGLAGFEQRAIGSLSAGQFHRMLFARLLLQDAAVLLLDEPFTAIDGSTTRDLLRLIRRCHDEGRIVVAVLHDLDVARAHFADTLLLARTVVAWGPTANVLTQENLSRARLIAESWDDAVGTRACHAAQVGGAA